MHSFMPSSEKTLAAAYCMIYGVPLNFVDCLLFHISRRLIRCPSDTVNTSSFGTIVYEKRVPVNPAVLDREQNSTAHFFAPSTE